jgi:hypothetical protein
MKLPHRPWYPPTENARDIFDLVTPSLLGEVVESTSARAARFAKVEQGVSDAFRAAANHLGEEEARRLFRKTTRKPKRGPGGAINPERDRILLRAYDERPADQSLAAVARLLEKWAIETGIRLGSNADAIAAHLRKLLAERARRQRAAAVEARRLRMAMRNDPPSLLGSTKK